MTKRRNKAGRADREPRFVQIPYWVLESDAFRSLSAVAVKVFIYLLKRFNGRNNGKIGFGVRSGCYVWDRETRRLKDVSIGIGRTRLAEALKELEEAGFIVCEKSSLFRRETDYAEGHRLVREWRLTMLPTASDRIPTREFASRVGGPVRHRRHRSGKIRFPSAHLD
jgi:hypothetical protein